LSRLTNPDHARDNFGGGRRRGGSIVPRASSALRLANAAFKGERETDVTANILFLQKRSPETPRRGESWIEPHLH
jgi:hypothetical protein